MDDGPGNLRIAFKLLTMRLIVVMRDCPLLTSSLIHS